MIPRNSLLGSKFFLFNDIHRSPYIGTKFNKSYPVFNKNNILPRDNGYLGYFDHSNSKSKINNKDIEVMNEYFNPELLLKVGKKMAEDITSTDIRKNPYIGHKIYSTAHFKKSNDINKTNPHIGYTKRQLPIKKQKSVYDKKVFLEIGKMLSRQQ